MSVTSRAAVNGPLRTRDFRLLLAGAAAAQFGAHVTLVALPLVAVLELDASAFQVGLLTAAETAAFLVIGLPAGAWVDRMRKVPLMIRADVVRAVAMGSVPMAGVAGVLTMAQLYAVALVTGAATVFFDVAHQSFLPHLLPRDQLVKGNGALETVRSSAQVTGPDSAAAWSSSSAPTWPSSPMPSATPSPRSAWGGSGSRSPVPNPFPARRCARTSVRGCASCWAGRCCG
ncbi:hypothetical protein SGRIM128S_02464 [Streptomyces griseomycini]